MRKATLFLRALLAMATTFAAAGAFAAETNRAAPPSRAVTAHEITKEQAMEMALKAHPGKVTKAYEDTKKGKKTWEVKIDGATAKSGRCITKSRPANWSPRKASNARLSHPSPPHQRRGGIKPTTPFKP
jgi:hypothetical protein